ncbi:MAG: A24 family peptidase [Phycisphaerales bacterium]|nr:A24 family peptidase [Phycisphaerales bacterium]
MKEEASPARDEKAIDSGSAGLSAAPSGDLVGAVSGGGAALPGEARGLAWWSPGVWIGVISLAAATASVWQIGMSRTDRGFFVTALASIVLFGAAWVDAACRRIPNRLTYPGMLLGLFFNLVVPLVLAPAGMKVALLWLGAAEPRDAVLGFLVCAVLGIGSFVAGGLGGGDAKVLGMIGAFLGLTAVLPVLFNAILFAAVIGVVNLLLGGALVAALQKVAFASLKAAWPSFATVTPARFRRSEAPFAVSVLLGFLLAQVYSPMDFFVHWIRSF